MTLRVPFSHFAEAVERHLTSKDVYMISDRARTLLSAGDGEKKVIVLSSTRMSQSLAQAQLLEKGFTVTEGYWSLNDDQDVLELPYIGAVSYRANKDATGVWVEAFAKQPTEVEILQRMMDEFAAEGLIQDMTLDEFRTSAQVTAIILDPLQVDAFMHPGPAQNALLKRGT